jgi:hypothetical protein
MKSAQSTPLLVVVIATLGASACTPQVEAPEDLEGLARFFWSQGLEVSDADIDEAAGNAAAVLEELLTDGEAKVGSLPRLEPEDLEVVGLQDTNDPSNAPGLFLANKFDCDIDVLADALTSLDQPGLHPGVYDSYDRVFDNDREAWLAGTDGTLSWNVEYAATPTATQYTAKTRSSIRKVPKGDATVGPSLIQRTVLREPAVFEGNPDNHVFDQDYQSDVFFDAGDGEVLHIYGLWRYMQLGVVSVYDDVFVNFQLDGMIQWDDQTEAACATWPELPGE